MKVFSHILLSTQTVLKIQKISKIIWKDNYIIPVIIKDCKIQSIIYPNFTWQLTYCFYAQCVKIFSDPHTGWPVTLHTPGTIEKVHELANYDRRMIIWLLTDELDIKKQAVPQILCADYLPRCPDRHENIETIQKFNNEIMRHHHILSATIYLFR